MYLACAARRAICSGLSVCCFVLFASRVEAESLLPDLIPWASQPHGYMYGGTVHASLVPGKTVYRFNQPIPNIGDGPLELRLENHPDNSQDIYQQILDANGDLSEEHHVGTFENVNPPYGSMYLEGIAHYQIREVLPGNGVGSILTTHEKISYALVDGPAYDLELDGAPDERQYTSGSGPILGISVGWADLYSFTLPGQWADVTGLAIGEYWLESVIDPFDLIRETNELNNTITVKINLTVIPEPTILAGDYNRDGDVDAADFTLWRDTLGKNVSQGAAADGDGSARIGLPDYEVWKQHFGESDNGAGSGAVPEPASVGLALMAFAASGFVRTIAGRRT